MLRIDHSKKLRLSFVVLLGLSMLAPFAPAQQTSKMKGAVIKNRAPVNKDVLKVKLPKPFEATLKNGLTVLILENHKLPTVSMQLQISGAGDLFDPKDTPGLAAVTASMLREGTKTRTSDQIAAGIDEIGGTLNTGAGFGSSAASINASGLVDNFDTLLDYMTDLLLNPVFPEKEFNRIVSLQKTNLQQQRTNAAFLANEMFSKVVYGDHPAAIRSTNLAALEKMTPEMLRGFHAAHYAAGNAILGIVGDVNPKELMPKIEKAFGSWQRGTMVEAKWPEPPTPNKPRVFLIDRKGSVQTNLILGDLGITRTNPDYIALQVMNRVVGGNATARLFMNLREDKGYTYGAYSSLSALQYPGTWQATSEVRTDVTEGSMKEFMIELNRIRDEKVPAQELDDVKRSLVAGFALSLENPNALLNNAITLKIYHLPANYWDTYTEKIAAITADEVQAIARKYVGLDHLTIIAVGDASKIKDVMSKYGEVELYNTEGQRVGG